MPAKPTSVAGYLASLPEDRRASLTAVRNVILKNLDKDYTEGALYGMIGYYVPHSVYPAGYHCDPKLPLPFAMLGSQKNYMSLYLMSVYTGGVPGGPAAEYRQWFRDAWAQTGKKLDMGKSCIRFKTAADLPLEVIGEAIRRVPAKTYVAFVEAAVGSAKRKRASARAAG